jgi:phage tail sheath protein FI
MAEYLAPGVFIEEVSYRSKSIEGVSTTTTGFVGPTRYGPIEIEPDVITNVTEFERVYGDGRQLVFGDTILHNYLWHAVRAFFEEGGMRLYVARTFSPVVDPDKGYQRPTGAITDDTVQPIAGIGYGQDGHARLWITSANVAMTVAERAVSKLVAGIYGLSPQIKAASSAADVLAPKSNAQQDDKQILLRSAKLTQLIDNTAANLTVAKSKVATIPGTPVNLTETENALEALGEATNISKAPYDELDKDKIVVPAASDAKDSTTGALNQVIILAGKALDLANVATAQALKDMAITLQSKCTAAGPAPNDSGGNIWLAYNLAKTKASEAHDSATKLGTAPGGTTRLQVLQAADISLKETQKLNAALNEVKADLESILVLAGNTTDETLTTALVELSSNVGSLKTATEAAQLAVQRNAYLRAFGLVVLLSLQDKLLTEIGKVEKATGEAAKALLASLPEPDGATLLRARFPGAEGNISIRVTARAGQNVLVVDANDLSKSLVKGVLPGDLVFIGQEAGGGQDANKLYLAYPTSDGADWYFSTDEKQSTAKYSLNNVAGTKLVPTQHEVCVVSCEVEFSEPNGSRILSGLAFQPGHTRSGAADSVTAKFQHDPKNGIDARTLPFEILTHDSVKTGRQVLGALLKIAVEDAIAKATWPITTTHLLLGGNDGSRPGADEYAGRGTGPDAAKTGLKALEDIEDISIVAGPGAMFGYMNGYQSQAQQIVGKLISHAENMKYRVAVLESGDGQGISDVRAMRARYDSKHAAFYYPWVRVLDPITRGEINLPPSGFVAGIYARNDIDRAVYKAPANEVVRGAIGFETLINKAQQEVLNPEGVNCFRFFEGRGFRLWGARTISSDPDWKYVNVRRYFAYLERSIDRGTQWAVFEPNGESLWANVKETISDFLYNEWKNGALLGADPKSAYFVRCDRSTMTQNDLDNGRLICKIGVVALKPAEFVIFQIGQWTSDRKA